MTDVAAARALPSPLDVLLAAMHRKWGDGDHDGATALARVAAPYLHARRLAARGETDLEAMDDAELDAICRLAASAPVGATPAGPGRRARGAGAARTDPRQPDMLG